MTSSHPTTAQPTETAPSEEIVRGLVQAILEHRIPPGAKLSEDEVGEIFGAGRTIVRAALQSLAHRNLVTIKRNRGAFVAHPDPREAREVFEARALLEPRTSFSAAQRATPDAIARLQRHTEAEHAALATGDLGRAVYLSGLFHIEIAEIAAQRTIADFIATLVSRSSLIIALYWKRRDALCETHAHHALTEAIATHDGPRAEELMHSHLVDLLSGLDLRDRAESPRSLRDLLHDR